MNSVSRLALLGFGLLSLSALQACGGNKGTSAQDILGVSRSGPDAFNMVSRPPLTLPPDFALRPPAPDGTPGPGELQANDTARTLLTGESTTEPLSMDAPRVPTAVVGVKTGSLASPAERSLMERFGAQADHSEIRQQLSQEALETKNDVSWIDDVVPTFRAKKENTIDPVAETERLRASDDRDAVQAPPQEILATVAKTGTNAVQPNVAKGADAKRAAAKGDFGIGLAPGRQIKQSQ